MGSSSSDQWADCARKKRTVALNELRVLDDTTTINAMLIVPHSMVQSVTICKKLEPLKRTINEAQSVPQ